MTTAPTPTGLNLIHEQGLSLRVRFGETELLRYVYQPWDAPLESPRPYFHPLRTLGGDVVSLYRPHDHVWHKGIALSLPNVGEQNFWGGTTYSKEHGYRQLDNDGSMRHVEFELIDATEQIVRVAHKLHWVTSFGATWFHEKRAFTVTAQEDSWTLAFATEFTNVSDETHAFGSPTTKGRDNAGYGGFFWRGPRSFTDGTVYAPGVTGGDELMGVRGPWMGFSGKHDDAAAKDGSSTLVFAESPDNPSSPTQWFVRANPFAAVCPAPFFSEEIEVAPGGSLTLRYAVSIADGDSGPDGAENLAKVALDSLATLPEV